MIKHPRDFYIRDWYESKEHAFACPIYHSENPECEKYDNCLCHKAWFLKPFDSMDNICSRCNRVFSSYKNGIKVCVPNCINPECDGLIYHAIDTN